MAVAVGDLPEVELEWLSFSNAAIPDGLSDISQPLSDFISAIQTGLAAVEVAFSIVQTVLNITQQFTDLLAATIGLVRDAILKIVEAVRETDMYFAMHFPKSLGTLQTQPAWLDAMLGSMTDQLDPEAPNFTNQVYQYGAVFMLTAPDITALLESIQALSDANFLGPISLPRKEDLELTKDELQEAYGQNTNRGGGQEPNWNSGKFMEALPFFDDMTAFFERTLSVVTLMPSISVLIDAFVSAINARIALLSEINTKLQSLFATFDALGAIDMLILPFGGAYTTTELQAALRAVPLPAQGKKKTTKILADEWENIHFPLIQDLRATQSDDPFSTVSRTFHQEFEVLGKVVEDGKVFVEIEEPIQNSDLMAAGFMMVMTDPFTTAAAAGFDAATMFFKLFGVPTI